MKVLLVANSSFMIANFRSGLIRTLIGEGHEVIALAPKDSHTDIIKSWGVRFRHLHLLPHSISPLSEIKTFLQIFKVLKSERPGAILSFSIKPNLYGALAASFLGISLVPNVTGLGYVFDAGWLTRRLVQKSYRFAFKQCSTVFLQNSVDMDKFLELGIIASEQARLLPGSGVDLSEFSFEGLPSSRDEVKFLLSSRMLREKGIYIFAEAAKALQSEFPNAKFYLLGPIVSGRKQTVTREKLEQLSRDSNIEYLGETADVRDYLRNVHCFVLPSFYREGTPKSLLEAGAIGRPIITTDRPGCRDVVIDGKTGYVCSPKDALDLANCMRKFIQLPHEDKSRMGFLSREHIEKRFDEKLVIDMYVKAISRICAHHGAR